MSSVSLPCEIVQDGIDRPVLVLMGDKDSETLPDQFLERTWAAGR
jgi:hypothetical protein